MNPTTTPYQNPAMQAEICLRTSATDIHERLLNLRDRARSLNERAGSVTDVVDGQRPAELKAEGGSAMSSALFEAWAEILGEVEAALIGVDCHLDRMAGRLA